MSHGSVMFKIQAEADSASGEDLRSAHRVSPYVPAQSKGTKGNRNEDCSNMTEKKLRQAAPNPPLEGHWPHPQGHSLTTSLKDYFFIPTHWCESISAWVWKDKSIQTIVATIPWLLGGSHSRKLSVRMKSKRGMSNAERSQSQSSTHSSLGGGREEVLGF